jgi:uncharacterized protein YlzI (FlbEa/FlbD family)
VEKDMMIKLQNGSPEHIGNPLYLSIDWISAVYPFAPEGGSVMTMIYGGPTGATWIVEDSVEEVIKKIKEERERT